MESVTEMAIKEIEAAEAEKFNHQVYCHHCQHMGPMRLLGSDPWGGIVFAHPGTGCTGLVHVTPARGSE